MIPIYAMGEDGRYREVKNETAVVAGVVRDLGINDHTANSKGSELVRVLSAGPTSFSHDAFTIFTPTATLERNFPDSQSYANGVTSLFSGLVEYGERRGGDAVLVDSLEFSVKVPRRIVKANVCALKRAK